MAEAPPLVLGIPPEQRTNGAKLSRLIFDEGGAAIRSLFDRYHPSASLVAGLEQNYPTLLSLLEKKLITQKQWELLFPTNSSVPCSQNMDMYLLFLLLHNICGLAEPRSGWNNQPSSSDDSLEGNLARLKWYICEVANRVPSRGVQTVQFDFYWYEITTALKSLGVCNSASTEDLKTTSLSEADENTYLMVLVEWGVRDQEIQDQLRSMEITSQKNKQMLTFMQQANDKTLKAMQDLTTGKMPFTWSKSSIIGTGGKGTKVYCGQLTPSGKQVAVKRMYSGVFDMKEAEKLRKCHHPNIIRCFSTHKEEEFFYIALELCEKTLKRCIDDEEFTSVDVSRRECLTQVSSGVVYLHENKICHRDIKPDNILLTMKNDEYTRRRFVLADFNCARDVPSGETFSTQHSTVGTAGWMAPEANEVGRRRTLKIDVFSLGCVFYYTLTNKKHPYGDINNGDKCQACINARQVQPVWEVDNFVEHACLCFLISRMVYSDQKRRPNSSEVHSHLVLKLADEELDRKVSNILEKLTPQTFQRQESQILELEIDSPERLKGVADRIFEKAICEPSFSATCAKMCSCLITGQEQTEGKGDNIACTSLVEALLNKCQEEIEENTFSRRNAELWFSQRIGRPNPIVQHRRELKLKKPSGDVVRRRSLGSIRFIGELFKLKILTENTMYDFIEQLLRSTDEESYKCLYNLLTTNGKDLDHEEAKPRMDEYFNLITEIIQNRVVPWGVSFMLMDVVELRKRRWAAVTEDNNSERDSTSNVGPQAKDVNDSVARGESKTSVDLPTYQNIGTKLKRSANPWVRHKYQVRESSEQAKTVDLYRKVLSILNKITPQKFQTLTKQILELEIDTPERLEGVIDRIFEKAISEPRFSVVYANMCRCLMTIKVQLDGKQANVTFRKILLNKCQKEFEKEKSEENLIHAKMDALAQKGLKEDELELRKTELEVDETEISMRRRSLGNIRFIGELFKLKMLTENIMHDCVVKLMRSTDEESYECFCELLTTIGKDLDHEKAKPRIDQYFDQINKIILAKRTSMRVHFMLKDVVELRKCNWIPQKEDGNPKTIDQIHKEVQGPEKNTKGTDKKVVAASRGRRRYWRKAGVGANQRGIRTQRTLNTEVHLQWRLEGQEMREKIKKLIRELHSTGSVTKAVKSFEDMKTIGKEHALVSTAMEILVDYTQRSSDRQATGQLFSALLKSGAVIMPVFALSVHNVLEFLEDIELDAPNIWRYFAEIIGIPAADGYLPMKTLKDCVDMMHQKTSACKMLKEVLVKAVDCSSDESFSSLWSRLQYSTFFASEAEAKEFLKRKQLKRSENFWEKPGDKENLPAEQAKTDRKDVAQPETKRDEKPQQHRPGTIEQLRYLIVMRKSSNQEVLEWIEKNVDKTNTTQFIRNLMTFVCEASTELTRGRYGSRASFECDEYLLGSRAILLRKYIGGDSKLELQALYALQSLFVALDHPPGFLQPFFIKMYLGKVVSKGSFFVWKRNKDSKENRERGVARKITTDFFEMLQNGDLDFLIPERDAYVALEQNEAQIGEQFPVPQDHLGMVIRSRRAFPE